MTDEKFVFVSDVKEKKTTARSARNARTHNGKGGRVKFPSDYLSKKEIEAMSGEVKSYKLNSLITWKEFKAMPDDIKVLYLTGIRNKWDVPFKVIADMLGVCQQHLSRETKRLGFANVYSKKNWDKDGFYAWVHGVPISAPVPAEPIEEIPVEESPVEEIREEVVPLSEVHEDSTKNESLVRAEPVIPMSGNMMFECPASQALEMVAKILGNANALLSIKWEVLPDKGSES